MKTLTLPAILLSFTIMLFAASGCKKSDTQSLDSYSDDPGFGCDTKVVLLKVANQPAKLLYFPPSYPTAADSWLIQMTVPGGLKVDCMACNHTADIAAMTLGATSPVTLDVVLTGEIKKIERSQPAIGVYLPYAVPYLITLDDIRR